MLESNSDREARIFSVFVEAAGFGKTNFEFTGMAPPHPDILFQSGSEKIAFELVELIDATYARRLGVMFSVINDLPKHYRLQPEEIRSVIDKQFGNAMIFVHFNEGLSSSRRRRSYTAIFEYIAKSGFEGEGDMALSAELHKILERITIYRGDFEGPRFDTASAGYVGDPSIEEITKKFHKKYEGAHQIQLLAYVDGHPMLPDEIWLPPLIDYLNENAVGSHFQKIWVFDLKSNSVKHCWESHDVD